MSVDGCRLVGVTGRSGSGKSTVSDYFRTQGYPVLDGDGIARAVTEPGSPVLGRLVEAFGGDILDERGALRRRLLADRAFATPQGTRQLTDITHPAIIAAMLDAVHRAAREGHKICFADGAAIVGEALEPYCDAIIVVTAPLEESIARITARDGVSPQAARRRLDAQLPEGRLRAAADHVIENDGTLESLRAKAAAVLRAVQGETNEREEETQ